MAYERVFKGKTRLFIPKSEINLLIKSDGVWGPGQGDRIRAQDLEDSKSKKHTMKSAILKVLTPNFLSIDWHKD